jgi:tetratricopeptide (TPR) repeat protein
VESSTTDTKAVQQRNFVEIDKPPSPLLLGAVLLVVGAIGFSPWFIVKMAREAPPVKAAAPIDTTQPNNWDIDAKWHHSHLFENHLNYITQARMGAQYQREKKFVKAAEAYTRLLEERSTNKAVNYTGRGNAYLSLGRYDLAVSDFSSAIGIDPVEASEAYRGRSEAYKALGQQKLSDDDMMKSMRLNH